MSEFTTGVLYSRSYEPDVLLSLPCSRQPYFHKNLNNKWNVFFLKDEWLEKAETLQFLRELSRSGITLLWFHDSEDYGWGFRLFDQGYEVTSATIAYDLEIELTEQELERRHPGIDISQEVIENEELRREYDHVLHDLIQSGRLRQEIHKGIDRVRLHCFNRILSPLQVQQLHTVFDLNLLCEYDEQTGSSLLYDSVDLFKEILGIEEMVWVNYTYLASGGREG
ncbi:hypothetical protein LOK74_03960 [Brevibacillus humidisoli]|uniref:hypothetical protein n=1 Tax=Brevibacillus humidisoli TaxID=2895522 RepID=UPI001E645F50|nr:hypothetical protein [Brevibacillus humidisoli]UFJ41679.1 hypothetical protein LOK74_03960 [Brevibacillus humidisoli]